jgi:hypothetical protein
MGYVGSLCRLFEWGPFAKASYGLAGRQWKASYGLAGRQWTTRYDLDQVWQAGSGAPIEEAQGDDERQVLRAKEHFAVVLPRHMGCPPLGLHASGGLDCAQLV